MYIHWETKLKIGNDLIDAEHQMLVMLCKKLDYAIKQKATKSHLMRILVELKKFTEFHFLSEENLMAEIYYPELAAHEEVHSHLLAQLDVLSRRINIDQTNPEEVLDFLWRWLSGHIEHDDRKIAEHIRSNARLTLSQESYNSIFRQ